jgi:hypothetical protein
MTSRFFCETEVKVKGIGKTDGAFLAAKVFLRD